MTQDSNISAKAVSSPSVDISFWKNILICLTKQNITQNSSVKKWKDYTVTMHSSCIICNNSFIRNMILCIVHYNGQI